MSGFDIIRAWKDETYRNSLSEEARALLPQHPSGIIELTDEALDDLIAQGGLSILSDSCNNNSCNHSNLV